MKRAIPLIIAIRIGIIFYERTLISRQGKEMIETLARSAKKIMTSVNLRQLHKIFMDRKMRYRTPIGPSLNLTQYSLAPVTREKGNEADKPACGIYEMWLDTPGGHKWLHYFGVYEELLKPLTTRPIRMLEIGVYKGGSLAVWRKYLHSQSLIVGVDIDPECKKFDNPDRGVFVRIGDQSDADFMNSIVAEFGPFDVVLDDGSHICSHMVASFNLLFLPGLSDGGLYIAEDTHTNFWTEYRDQSYSFLDLSKDLVDLMHSHYMQNESEKLFRLGSSAQIPSATVPRISAYIKEISFRDSIVVIRKSAHQRLPVTQHL